MSDRICAPLDQIPDALAKTGFILEYRVAQEFRKAGWWTIGGRYYADDVDGRARELDLVAYRTSKSKELDVVTAVLVSCKKDNETTWAFLTKDKPKHDPNFDWEPVHYWTDVQPLQTYLGSDSWKEKYIKELGKTYDNFKATKDIFAFQQIAAHKVAPKNDKAIFDSIVSLMKALDHEVEAVTSRAKGKKRIYIFSLLSVVDAAMVDVSYAGKKPVATEVEQLTHLARYMVRKRDLSALIHFVRSDKISQFVSALTQLANVNAKHMVTLVKRSYDAIQWNSSIQSYFASKLKARLIWTIGRFFRDNEFLSPSVEEVRFGFDSGKLAIQTDIYDDKLLEILNSDKSIRADIAKLLKDVARYEGYFVFEIDIPF